MMSRLAAGFLLLGAIACGSTPTQSQQDLATKQGQVCAKYCSGTTAIGICETKLAPYSQAAVDLYEPCKGDGKCITDGVKTKEASADALTFSRWACTTCGLTSTVKLNDDFARVISAYTTEVVESNRDGCDSPLKAIATTYPNATSAEEIATKEAACAAAAFKCFKVTTYSGDLCKA